MSANTKSKDSLRILQYLKSLHLLEVILILFKNFFIKNTVLAARAMIRKYKKTTKF